MRMRQEIEDAPVHYLGESNVGENAFWENLKEKCLQPDLKAFGLEGEVKRKERTMMTTTMTLMMMNLIK